MSTIYKGIIYDPLNSFIMIRFHKSSACLLPKVADPCSRQIWYGSDNMCISCRIWPHWSSALCSGLAKSLQNQAHERKRDHILALVYELRYVWASISFVVSSWNSLISNTVFIPISAQSAQISHFRWALIVWIFVARMNPKIYDFGHFQANSESYWSQYVSFMNRSG